MKCKDCKKLLKLFEDKVLSSVETQLAKCEKCVFFKEENKTKQQIQTYKNMRLLYVKKYWENY